MTGRGKRKKAHVLADRLKAELELTECDPVLTARDARDHGEWLRRDEIKFHLAIKETSLRVPLKKSLFFSGELDEDYYFGLITRMWRSHLTDEAQRVMEEHAT